MTKHGNLQNGVGWIRPAVLLLIGGWIVLSPAYRQVFGGRSEWFPRWVMFHGFGRDVCDVRFFTVSEDDPELQPLDRFEVLDRKRSWSTSKSLVRMGNKTAVERVTQKLCSALGPDADVRVSARCGSRGKWRVKKKTDTNACKAKRSDLRRSKAKRRGLRKPRVK